MGSHFKYHLPNEQQRNGDLDVLSVWYGGFYCSISTVGQHYISMSPAISRYRIALG